LSTVELVTELKQGRTREGGRIPGIKNYGVGSSTPSRGIAKRKAIMLTPCIFVRAPGPKRSSRFARKKKERSKEESSGR